MDVKTYLREIKSTGRCELCGIEGWWCLVFHHKQGRKRKKALCGKLKDVKAEVTNECSLLCANCHMYTHTFLLRYKANSLDFTTISPQEARESGGIYGE